MPRTIDTSEYDFPPCPICGAAVSGIDAETKMPERFFDGVGEVGDPGRFTISPEREMVPGDETITYSPCRHSEVKRRWVKASRTSRSGTTRPTAT